jgi:hypothetical protein
MGENKNQSRDPKIIQAGLSAKQNEEVKEPRLAFDFKTGELVISEEKMNSNNTLVVDQLYRDGFFADKKIIKA